MIKKWKFVSRKTILDHPRMKLAEDTVELPDGKKSDYVREMPGGVDSVACLAINKEGQVLIQREYSYPPDEIMYQLPGGAIENAEEVVDAANRELSEESGYIANDRKLLGYFYVNNRRSDRKQYVVLCRGLQVKKTQHDDVEYIESFWMTIDEINELVKKGQVVNVNMLAALRLYQSVS